MGKGKCPKCGGQLSAEAGTTHITCPGCGNRYRVRPASERGAQEPPPAGRVMSNAEPTSPDSTSPIGGQWYAGVGDQRVGPLDSDQLMELAQSGQLTAETLVWKKDIGNWAKASSVPEIAQLLDEVYSRASADVEDGPPPLPAEVPQGGEAWSAFPGSPPPPPVPGEQMTAAPPTAVGPLPGPRLNKQQWLVIWAGVALIFLMLLVPPWRCNINRVGSSVQTRYSLLFLPPDSVPASDFPQFRFHVFDAEIDVGRLAVQCCTVAVAVAAALFGLRKESAILTKLLEALPPVRKIALFVLAAVGVVLVLCVIVLMCKDYIHS